MTTKPTTTATEWRTAKIICFYYQTLTLHVYHAILYISLASLHHCDNKLPNFTSPLYGAGEHNKKIVDFFSKLRWPQIRSKRKFGQDLPNWMKLNEVGEVWNSANRLLPTSLKVWPPLISSHSFMQTLTNQKWRTVSSWLLIGLNLHEVNKIIINAFTLLGSLL